MTDAQLGAMLFAFVTGFALRVVFDPQQRDWLETTLAAIIGLVCGVLTVACIVADLS